LDRVPFFKKKKVKKKVFKKNTFLLKNLNFESYLKIGLKLPIKLFYKYKYDLCNLSKSVRGVVDNSVLNINQKCNNTKASVTLKKKLATFSTGIIIKYFKVKQGKYIRKSLKGVKIFLNFLKAYFLKKSLILSKDNCNNLFIQVDGFDFNLNSLKKVLKSFVTANVTNVYFMVNLKVSFSKVKGKKIKSIKKRLKKKMLLNFLRSNSK
jgi:hypothetical protein